MNIFFFSAAFAAEPLMDSSIFATARVSALNSFKEGGYEQALRSEQLALKIAQDLYGPTSLSLVPILNDKATLHWRLAQYAEAEQDFKWSLALLEKNLGPDDPKVGDLLDLLAGLYLDLDRLAEAELLEKRALALRRADAACDPQALARSLGFLGRIENGLKNYQQAQTLFNQALATLEKTPHPDPALSISLWKNLERAPGLATTFADKAAPFEKILDLAKKNFGPESAQAADAMLDYGDFYHFNAKEEQAKPLYESALKIAQGMVGAYFDFPALPYMKRLARAERSLGQYKAARDLLEKTLQTEKKVLGAHHPQGALDLIQLADMESATGEKSKAEADLKEALAILSSQFKETHSLVVQVKSLLDGLKNR